MDVGRLIRETRVAEGLTQSQLAERMGTTQSAIARLESHRSNPRILTLRSAFAAMGRRLAVDGSEPVAPVDESLIVPHLALTPAERLDAFQASYRNMRSLMSGLRRG